MSLLFRRFSLLLLVASLGSRLLAQVPGLLNYQGSVSVDGQSFEGGALFKFALVNTDGSTSYWSNDQSSVNGGAPTASVALNVSKGLFSVRLGDTQLPNMTSIPATVFNQPDVHLRIWFNDGVRGWELLAPDQRIASVGYAMTAANVPDGSITSAKLSISAVTSEKMASGAALANLGASGMDAIPAGGLIIASEGSEILNNQDYTQIGVVTQPNEKPSGRYGHSAVWTGKEMVIFGGATFAFPESSSGLSTKVELKDGFSYSPTEGSWKKISRSGAPRGRFGHCAFWTGSEMIIWGGTFARGYGNNAINDGARYFPDTDTWLPLPTSGAPLGGVANQRAVWTGRELIVWGGVNMDSPANTGAKYDPQTNTWTPISTIGAPTARAHHFLVWSGSHVFVIGGLIQNYSAAGGGAKYDPITDSWSPIALDGLPEWINSSNYLETAAYAVFGSGDELLVWDAPGAAIHKYDLIQNLWSRIPLTPEVSALGGSVAINWTGNKLLIGMGVLRGEDNYLTFNKKIYFLDPKVNSWSEGPSLNDISYGAVAPSLVKCNNIMVFWGGSGSTINPYGQDYYSNDGDGVDYGAVYNLDTDIWQPMEKKRDQYFLLQRRNR